MKQSWGKSIRWSVEDHNSIGTVFIYLQVVRKKEAWLSVCVILITAIITRHMDFDYCGQVNCIGTLYECLKVARKWTNHENQTQLIF